MKLDCPVCGQDVFAKEVVHVHGARRMVAATGRCRQCGYGVRLRELYVAGQRVDAQIQTLDPTQPPNHPTTKPSNHPTIKPSNRRPRRRP